MLELNPQEQIVLNAITKAAQHDRVCPTNLDLEMMIGCNSSSVAPSVVKRLENYGLIYVERHQRFRRVKILATGQWTAKSPSQHTTRPHVPRGARQNAVAGRIAKKARQMR